MRTKVGERNRFLDLKASEEREAFACDPRFELRTELLHSTVVVAVLGLEKRATLDPLLFVRQLLSRARR